MNAHWGTRKRYSVTKRWIINDFNYSSCHAVDVIKSVYKATIATAQTTGSKEVQIFTLKVVTEKFPGNRFCCLLSFCVIKALDKVNIHLAK